MSQELLKQVMIEIVKTESGADTAEVDSDAIDMEGWEGVIFMTTFGTGHAANNYISAQQGATASPTTALANTKVLATVAKPTVLLDVFKPTKRYLRCVAIRGTSSTLGPIYAIKYGARKMPYDNAGQTDVNAESHVSPDEGSI